MKDALQVQSLYIGVDVSKLTLDVSLLTAAGNHHYQQFENTKAGLRRLDKWLLQQPGFTYACGLFCMEHTGIYCRQLVAFLLLQNAKVWMESALHLKRSIGMIRGKNDKVDSYRIARYAMMNRDAAKLVSPPILPFSSWEIFSLTEQESAKRFNPSMFQSESLPRSIKQLEVSL